MSLTIKDKTGKTRGHWVAKTSRGFSRKQLKEIQKLRETLGYGIQKRNQ